MEHAKRSRSQVALIVIGVIVAYVAIVITHPQGVRSLPGGAAPLQWRADVHRDGEADRAAECGRLRGGDGMLGTRRLDGHRRVPAGPRHVRLPRPGAPGPKRGSPGSRSLVAPERWVRERV